MSLQPCSAVLAMFANTQIRCPSACPVSRVKACSCPKGIKHSSLSKGLGDPRPSCRRSFTSMLVLPRPDIGCSQGRHGQARLLWLPVDQTITGRPAARMHAGTSLHEGFVLPTCLLPGHAAAGGSCVGVSCQGICAARSNVNAGSRLCCARLSQEASRDEIKWM